MLEALINEVLTGIGHGEIGQLPDTPDNLYVLYFAGGNGPERHFKSGTNAKRKLITEPQIQVRVRNTSYYKAYEMVVKIMNLLEGYKGTLGDVKVIDLKRVGEPMFMGRDNKNRSEFSLNVIVTTDGEVTTSGEE